MTPVKATEFEFVSVKVKVEVPFTTIGLGEKALVNEGGTGTPHPVMITLSSTTLGSVPVAFAPISLIRKAVVLEPVVLAVAVFPASQFVLVIGF